MQKPATIAASRIPVPVAESQLSAYTAPSLAGLATTGGTFSTIWCRCGTGYLKTDTPSSHDLNCGAPHANTNTESTIHGNQARNRVPPACFTRALPTTPAPTGAALAPTISTGGAGSS